MKERNDGFEQLPKRKRWRPSKAEIQARLAVALSSSDSSENKTEEQKEMPKRRWRPPKVRTSEELAALLKKGGRKSVKRDKKDKVLQDNEEHEEDKEEVFIPTNWDEIKFSDVLLIKDLWMIDIKELKEDKLGKYIEVVWKKFYEWKAWADISYVFKRTWSSVFLWDKVPWLNLWKWILFKQNQSFSYKELNVYNTQLNGNWETVLKKIRVSKIIGRVEGNSSIFSRYWG